MWNRSGNRPAGCDVLDRAARALDPEFTTVWRGGGEPVHQGVVILGTPLGHEDFVRAQLEHIVEEHNVLLERIPSVPDVQSAWALLLHCANARANYALRVVRPDLARQFAQAHDAGLWRCLCAIVRVGEDQCDPLAKDAASLPLSMGGLGLRSAVRTSNSAFWASWADSLPMVRERHPEVADLVVDALDSDPATPILSAVVEAARAVQVGGFVPPSWATLSHGARPPPREPDEFEPGCSRRGWQHEAAGPTERMHRDTWIMPRLTDSERAALRSQSGRRIWSGIVFHSFLPSSEN